MKKSDLVLISTSLKDGGAARAAKRWQQCLGIEFVDSKKQRTRIAQKCNQFLERIILSNWNHSMFGAPSLQFFGSFRLKQYLTAKSQFGFIHWVQGGFLSLIQLVKSSSRLIIYCHDQWWLTNVGHYKTAGNDTSKKNFLKFVYNLKIRILNKSLAIISPSKWLADQLAFETGIATFVIPNPVPEVFFNAPFRNKARDILNIERAVPVLLLISDSNFNNRRKGMDLAVQVIEELNKTFREKFIVVTVGSTQQNFFPSEVEILDFGYIKNDYQLACLYSAANCTLIPSRLDNFPQTSTESQSAGTPVVTFNTGGAAETVIEKSLTGEIVDDFNIKIAAKYVHRFFNVRRVNNQKEIRDLASRHWSYEVISARFNEVLSQLKTEVV